MGKKIEGEKIAEVLLMILAALVLFFFIKRLFHGFEEEINPDIVTDEGEEILESKEKRDKLSEALEDYQSNGSWDKLSKIND